MIALTIAIIMIGYIVIALLGTVLGMCFWYYIYDTECLRNQTEQGKLLNRANNIVTMSWAWIVVVIMYPFVLLFYSKEIFNKYIKQK